MTDAGSDRTLTRRRALLGIGLLGGGVAAGGLGWRALTRSDPVTVGGTLPLSGALAPIGVPLYRGLVHWAETVAANGGLAGRDVDVDIADDEGEADLAREYYEDHAADRDLLVSPYGSPLTGAVVDVVEAAAVPCIAHTAGDRAIWADGRTWTVQMLNPVDTFLHPLLGVASDAGALSIGFVHRDDSFTSTTVAGAVERARAAGWDVREPVVYSADAERNWAVSDALADAPDVLVGSGFQPGAAGGGFLPDAIALSRAYERAGAGAKLACWSIGASFADFREQRGDVADGEVGVTGWKPYVASPDNGSFVDRYADRWGNAPDSHAAQGYATGQLFAKAAAAAGTIESEPIRDALFALETETVFGRYAVTEQGLQVGKENAVVQWQDGEPVVVGPERWRAGELAYPVPSE